MCMGGGGSAKVPKPGNLRHCHHRYPHHRRHRRHPKPPKQLQAADAKPDIKIGAAKKAANY